ncbi:hypothetical protein [Rubrivivax rivuli]|uniref:Uncharacterized protein n=1 Tax=Rubrivivax rivuli TaxID=1862385 RepID=A0A437RCU4_9BURK|nr:hypothetical protein [Rubrivivax rivuli]RVU44570.1 hypothetical protein EOE66_18080 [Rubrivivax rivuli]
MSTDTRHPLPARLHTLAAMAGLLERLEAAPSSASAEQYRSVAQRVRELLVDVSPDEHLHRLLQAAPHTAEVYENLRYELAGLCLHPLDTALAAEQAAAGAIARARALR